MVKIESLMTIEHVLLKINEKYRFNFSFNEQYKLKKYIKEIGDITSYFFEVQNEYFSTYKQMDKLKEYHESMMNEEVDYNGKEVLELIYELKENITDESLQNMIDDLKKLKLD